MVISLYLYALLHSRINLHRCIIEAKCMETTPNDAAWLLALLQRAVYNYVELVFGIKKDISYNYTIATSWCTIAKYFH